MIFDKFKQKNIQQMLKAIFVLPLAFAIVIFVLLYIVMSPYFSLVVSAFNLISIENKPSFNNDTESIFVPLDGDDSEEFTDSVDFTDDTAELETATGDSQENTDNTDESTDKINSADDPQEQYSDEIWEIENIPYSTVDISAITMPKYEQHYANLSISSLKVNCKLFYGDSDAVLKKGAGQFMGSYLPGFGKPILIAAHNTSYFRALEYAKVGHIVKIKTSYGTYNYKIYDTKIVEYTDSSAYDLTIDEEILILYTCYPFKSLGFKTKRLFVYASKVSGPVVNY